MSYRDNKMLRRCLFSYLVMVVAGAVGSVPLRAADTSESAPAVSVAPVVSATLLRHAGMERNWQVKLPLKPAERITEMLVFEDYLYVLTDRNYLFCIDRATSAMRFGFSLANPGLPRCRITYYDKKLWMMIGSRLVIIDPKTGTIADSVSLDMIGPSAVGGMSRNSQLLYIPGADHRLHAVVADEYWQRFSVTADNDSLITSVLAYEKAVFFATDAGNIVSILPDMPKKLWQFDVLGRISAPIVRDGDWLYVGCEDTKLYKLSTGEGRLGWKVPFQTSAPLTDAAVPGAGVIYQAAGDKGLYAIDKQTGRQLWRVPKGVSLLTEKAGRAYVLEKPSVLTVMDNDSARRLYSVNFAAVATNATNTADSTIYVAGANGRVMSIKIADDQRGR